MTHYQLQVGYRLAEAAPDRRARSGDQWDPVRRGTAAGAIRLLPPVGGPSLAAGFATLSRSALAPSDQLRKPEPFTTKPIVLSV